MREGSYCNKLVVSLCMSSCPMKTFKDTLDAFLQIQGTKVESLDLPFGFGRYSVEHLNCILDAIVLD
jgi:hypothetical protein